MSGARFPPDVTRGMQAKEFNLGFIRPENLVSHGLRVLAESPFGKLQAGSHVPFLLRRGFRLATPPSRPDWWSAAKMLFLLEALSE